MVICKINANKTIKDLTYKTVPDTGTFFLLSLLTEWVLVE